MSRRKPKTRFEQILDGEEGCIEVGQSVFSDRTHMCVRGWRIIYQQHGCSFPWPLLYHRRGFCMVPGREEQYTMDAHEEHALKKVTEREVRGWHDKVMGGFDGLTEEQRRERAYKEITEALHAKACVITGRALWGDPNPDLLRHIEAQRRDNAILALQADALAIVPEFNKRYRNTAIPAEEEP